MSDKCSESARIASLETSLKDLTNDVKSIKNYFMTFMLGHFIFFASCIFYAGFNVNQIKINTKNIERVYDGKI